MTGHRCLDCATGEEWNAASAEAMRRTYVLAGSWQEFMAWRGDAAPDSRVRYVGSVREVYGVVMSERVARIVRLPGFWRHPEAQRIAEVVHANRLKSRLPAPIDVAPGATEKDWHTFPWAVAKARAWATGILGGDGVRGRVWRDPYGAWCWGLRWVGDE